MGSPLPRVAFLARPSISLAYIQALSARVRRPGPQRRAAPASFGRPLVKSLQKLAADTASPQIGVDKNHGHVAIAGDDHSSPVLRATGFGQGHRHHFPVCIEVTDDQARLRLGQLLPDPGHPVNAGGLEPGDVSGVPYADGSLMISREPIENGQMHILIVPGLFGIVPGLFGALAALADP